jgi:hypothetical protein
MTLITNEIRLINGFKESLIISTADRRLTYDKPKSRKGKHGNGQKLYFIPYLNATLSFWGNYALKDGQDYFAWLPNFIRKNSGIGSLSEFSTKLRNDLNRDVRSNVLMQRPSGFHISGYTGSTPDFFHFSNCHWNGTHYIMDESDHLFRMPSSDYLGRDALGWNSTENSAPIVATTTYRNGDFKAHEASWDLLDDIFKNLSNVESFGGLKSLNNLGKVIQFKLKFIGALYSNFAYVKNIGGPFDIVILHYKEGKARLLFTTRKFPTGSRTS